MRKASLMHALVCAAMPAHRCVTERIGARTCLQNRVCSPPPALLCALARHLGQFDRVGVPAHRAAVVPWGLGCQPSQLDRESGFGNGSEGYSEGAIGVVLVF